MNRLIKKEKRITMRDRVNWSDLWSEYFWKKVMSNEHSPLCGLPARKHTEVYEDLETGDFVIRYIPQK